MQRVTIALGAVLAAQLVLAGVLHSGVLGGAQTAPAAAGSLAEYEPDSVDAIRITGADGGTLRIERGETGWRLPGSDGFPAGSSRVERLLRGLNGLDARLPVARTAAARERFRVGAERFERRVELLSGDETLATVLFGGSAGTGRVYARAAGRDTIHEVEFPLWHASAKPQKWYDSDVAAVDPASVRQAELPGFVLRRTEGKTWKLVDGEQAPSMTDPAKALRLVRRLAQPKIEDVTRAEPPDGNPVFAYTLTTKEGEEIRYRYFSTGDDKAPTLYRGDQPWRYTVAPKRLAQVRGSSPDKLLASKDDDGGSGTDGGSGASASSS